MAHSFSRFIFWYHDSKMINYEDPNGGGEGGGGVGGRSSTGVSVRTRMSGDGMETTSRLILRNAAPGDSGNYTCQPSNAQSASIHVFVSEGDFSSFNFDFCSEQLPCSAGHAKFGN